MTKPYTYIIHCIETNEYYYGVKYAKNCDPLDFWVKYFTSSNVVKDRIKLFGKDAFRFEIRKTFATAEQARVWEHTVLRRMNLSIRVNFMNKSNGVIFEHRSSKKGLEVYFSEVLNKYRFFPKDSVPTGWIKKGTPKPQSMKDALSAFQKTYIKTEAHKTAMLEGSKAACNALKGTTLEERHGKEKADRIKANHSKANKGKKSPNAGKTYDEIMGKEKSKKLRDAKSEKIKGDANFGTIKKGSTYEDVFGKERAEKLRKAKRKPNLKNRKQYLAKHDNGTHIIFDGTRQLRTWCELNDIPPGGLYGTLKKQSRTKCGYWLELISQKTPEQLD